MVTIDKAKGVLLVADDMYAGLTRKDILPKYTKLYNRSIPCIEKWMRSAQIIVDERRVADENKIREQNAQRSEAIATKLGITKEAILKEYAAVGMFDARRLYDEEGKLLQPSDWDQQTGSAVAGVDLDDEGRVIRVRLNNKKGALDSISKMMGYTIPDKADLLDNSNFSHEVIFE